MDKLEIQKSRFKKYTGMNESENITDEIIEMIMETPAGRDVTICGRSVTVSMSMRGMAAILQGRI